ncbi:DUF4387 family protein [Candidatus Rariloculus sp.]|uniref:DUF4387 family protein n=1 Tax=Candidatus Rariloculus sp. TaxID=3101265 RepID=UPI003D125DA7
MTRLGDLAVVLRSKNAGPLTLTIDIIFDDKDKYDRIVQSGIINQRSVSDLYDVDENDVLITAYAIVNAIKVSFPRKHVSGSVLDEKWTPRIGQCGK